MKKLSLVILSFVLISCSTANVSKFQMSKSEINEEFTNRSVASEGEKEGRILSNSGEYVVRDKETMLRDLAETGCTWVNGEDLLKKSSKIRDVAYNLLESKKTFWGYRIINEMLNLKVCFIDSPLKKLKLVDDVTVVNYKTKQIAVRIDDTVIIDSATFNSMNDWNRAYVLYHEALHGLIENSKIRNIQIRSAVNNIANMNNLTQDEFLKQIRNNGFSIGTFEQGDFVNVEYDFPYAFTLLEKNSPYLIKPIMNVFCARKYRNTDLEREERCKEVVFSKPVDRVVEISDSKKKIEYVLYLKDNVVGFIHDDRKVTFIAENEANEAKIYGSRIVLYRFEKLIGIVRLNKPYVITKVTLPKIKSMRSYFVEAGNNLIFKYDQALIKDEQVNEQIEKFPVLINENDEVIYLKYPITINQNSNYIHIFDERTYSGQGTFIGVLTKDGKAVFADRAILMRGHYSYKVVNVGDELYIRKNDTDFSLWDRAKEPKIVFGNGYDSYTYRSFKNSNIFSIEDFQGANVLEYLDEYYNNQSFKIDAGTTVIHNDHLLVNTRYDMIHVAHIFDNRIEICKFTNKYHNFNDPITETKDGVVTTYFVKGDKNKIDTFKTYNLSKCQPSGESQSKAEHSVIKLYEKK